MAFGVFIHRPDSIYDDIPSERYQFPKQYLSRVRQCEGDWVVYLEPSKVRDTRGYFAVAKVQEVVPDPRVNGMFLAIIAPGTYLDFGDPVAFRDDGQVVERGVLNDAGAISGRAQAAVRTLSPVDFTRIIRLGLGEEDTTCRASGIGLLRMASPRRRPRSTLTRLRSGCGSLRAVPSGTGTFASRCCARMANAARSPG
jgi:hypothetical protein